MITILTWFFYVYGRECRICCESLFSRHSKNEYCLGEYDTCNTRTMESDAYHYCLRIRGSCDTDDIVTPPAKSTRSFTVTVTKEHRTVSLPNVFIPNLCIPIVNYVR